MKVLVTGAAGFVGFHLTRRLLQQGAAVVSLDSVNSYYEPALKEARLKVLSALPGFSFVRGDLARRPDVAAAFDQGPFDAVVHLAAQAGVRYSLEHPEQYIDSNIVGFLSILEECRSRRVPHLVYASSSSVYGLNASVPFSTEQNVDHPVSLYAATKKANELMAHAYSHLYGIPTTGLRFFTVYGPWGRPDMAYFKFTESIFAGRPIEIFNHGDLWRDFTYIDDVVEGIVRLIPLVPMGDAAWDPAHPSPSSSSAPYRVYNIGNHDPVKVVDFVAILERVIGRPAKLVMKPMQAGDVVSTFADTADLRRVTGFAPSTPLEKGLTEFVNWYRSYRHL